MSKSTWNVYENAIQSFERFRNRFGIENIWSPPIDHLINHIAFLSIKKKGYSPATAKSYISGISYKIKINNLEDRTQSCILKRMLQGMQRLDKKNDSRTPITIDILQKIIPILHMVCSSNYETHLLSAAFLFAFFGFLRIGEITETGNASDNHVIKISDIKFEGNNLKVTIQSSKTDQIVNSTTLILPKNKCESMCVARQLKAYLKFRPNIDGQLFCHLNHKKLTRFQFLAILRSALKFIGLSSDDYNTHSFRIGAATTAAMLGKNDNEIKSMGRWKSDSFKRYIRMDCLIKI